MKRNDLQELRGHSVAELREVAESKRLELLKGRISQAVEGKGLGIRARNVRRDIARLETLITEKSKNEVQA